MCMLKQAVIDKTPLVKNSLFPCIGPSKGKLLWCLKIMFVWAN